MKLEKFLNRNKIDRSDFARTISVSQPALHRYLTGERFPRPEHLKSIISATKGEVMPHDFLDCDVASLVRGSKK